MNGTSLQSLSGKRCTTFPVLDDPPASRVRAFGTDTESGSDSSQAAAGAAFPRSLGTGNDDRQASGNDSRKGVSLEGSELTICNQGNKANASSGQESARTAEDQVRVTQALTALAHSLMS